MIAQFWGNTSVRSLFWIARPYSKMYFQLSVFKKLNIHHEGHEDHEEKQRKLCNFSCFLKFLRELRVLRG